MRQDLDLLAELVEVGLALVERRYVGDLRSDRQHGRGGSLEILWQTALVSSGGPVGAVDDDHVIGSLDILQTDDRCAAALTDDGHDHGIGRLETADVRRMLERRDDGCLEVLNPFGVYFSSALLTLRPRCSAACGSYRSSRAFCQTESPPALAAGFWGSFASGPGESGKPTFIVNKTPYPWRKMYPGFGVAELTLQPVEKRSPL